MILNNFKEPVQTNLFTAKNGNTPSIKSRPKNGRVGENRVLINSKNKIRVKSEIAFGLI